jgi:RHS repeat-associated protein
VTLDSSGNVLGQQEHLPFGEDFAESGTQEKHHFTGYERDSESGLDYAINRVCSSATGRYLRPGPNGRSYNLAAPRTMNRYAYVNNDPINSVDPLGLDGFCLIHTVGTIYFSSFRAYAWLFITVIGCWGQTIPTSNPTGNNPGGGQSSASSPNDMVKDYLNNQKDSDCLNVLNTFNLANGAPDMNTLATNTTIRDINTIAANAGLTLGQLNHSGLTFGDLNLTSSNDVNYNKPVMTVLGSGTDTDAIVVHAPGGVGWNVILGANWFLSADRGRKLAELAHELLQVASNGWTDSQIADDFGLTYDKADGNQDATDINASRAITKFIKGGCKQ